MTDNIIYKWIQCPNCNHKLFKLQDGKRFKIEIKCDKCKAVVAVSNDAGTNMIGFGKPFPPHLETK